MKGLRLVGTPRTLTRRMLSAVLVTQGFAVFLWALVAFQLARTHDDGAPRLFLWGGLAVAVLAFVAAGLLRRPAGLALGWLVQVACLLMAVVVPLMLLVELLFGALWITSLVQGEKVDDLREDAAAKYAEYERRHGSLPEPPDRVGP